MKKSMKKLATLLMLCAMVGFMGCSTSLGEDEVTPTVPVQPSNPEGQEGEEGSGTPSEQTGGSGSGETGEQTGGSESGKTEGDQTEGNTDQESEENPVVKPVGPTELGTEKIGDITYKTVTFGVWPQTKYDGLAEDLTQCTEGINGWDQCVCFTDGTDKYIKSKALETKYEFTKGTDYYFKVEPIEWRVLTTDYNSPGKKLLYAQKALDAVPFDNPTNEEEISNKYELSTIRKYLNEDFYNKAFSEGEKKSIQNTLIDNSKTTTIGNGQTSEGQTENLSQNTNDNIFLLSLSEITNNSYGFTNYDETQDNEDNIKRYRVATDYARATGTYTDQGNCCYWLRSPVTATEKNGQTVYALQIVGEDGRNGWSGPQSNFGVVPALVL